MHHFRENIRNSFLMGGSLSLTQQQQSCKQALLQKSRPDDELARC